MGLWQNIAKWLGVKLEADRVKSFFAPYVSGGYVGRNYDIDASKAGYALAQALSIPVYRAINARMVAIGGLTWELVRRDDDTVIYRSDTHASGNHFVRAIMQEGRELGYDVFGMWQMYKCIAGEVYIFKVRNRFDYPAAIELLNPVAVTPQVAGGDVMSYHYQTAAGVKILDADDVIVDRYPNALDPFAGLSPIQVALDSVNIDRNANRFFLAFFRNNASFGKIISGKDNLPLTEDDVNFIQTWMRENATGVANSFKTLLSRVPLEVDHQPIPDMTQPLELLDWYTRSVYSAFGVSRSVAGDTDGSRYQASPQDLNWFYLNTIIPEARRIANVVNMHIIPFLEPAANYYFRFDTGAWEMVNESEQRRADRAVALYNAGVLQLDEVRSELGYPPIEQRDGDSRTGVSLQVIDNRPDREKVVIAGHSYDIHDIKYSLDDARDEIRAWYRFVLRGNKRDFAPVFTRGWAYDVMSEAHKQYLKTQDKAKLKEVYVMLIDKHTSKKDAVMRELSKAIAGARVVSVKAWLDDSKEEFTNGFSAIVEDFVQGEIDKQEAYGAIAELIRKFAEAMMVETAREAGQEIDDSTWREFESMLNEQNIFVMDYLHRVQEDVSALLRERGEDIALVGAAAGSIATLLQPFVSSLLERVGLWFDNSVMPFLELVWSRLTGDPVLEFTGQDGRESCETCQKLKGQRHRRSEWLSRGLDPKNSNNRKNFECGLWQCMHYLAPVNAPTRGNWLA